MHRDVQWFRGRLVSKAQRRLHHSTLGLSNVEEGLREEVPRVGYEVTSGFRLTGRVYKVVVQKSIPAQIRQLILDIDKYKG